MEGRGRRKRTKVDYANLHSGILTFDELDFDLNDENFENVSKDPNYESNDEFSSDYEELSDDISESDYEIIRRNVIRERSNDNMHEHPQRATHEHFKNLLDSLSQVPDHLDVTDQSKLTRDTVLTEKLDNNNINANTSSNGKYENEKNEIFRISKVV